MRFFFFFKEDIGGGNSVKSCSYSCKVETKTLCKVILFHSLIKPNKLIRISFLNLIPFPLLHDSIPFSSVNQMAPYYSEVRYTHNLCKILMQLNAILRYLIANHIRREY